MFPHKLRLQDTSFGVLWKIATAVHAKYDKVVKLTNNKIM